MKKETCNMNYNFSQDLKAILEILELAQTELAVQLGVEQVTISRNELGKTSPSSRLLEQVYQFAFVKKIKLNLLKEMLWTENLNSNHKLLFHGAKSELSSELNLSRSRSNNDFGQGFYTGES